MKVMLPKSRQSKSVVKTVKPKMAIGVIIEEEEQTQPEVVEVPKLCVPVIDWAETDLYRRYVEHGNDDFSQ